MPLIPLSSFWVTNEPGGGENFGFPIRLHWRSVLATYLRTWVPGLAGLAFLVPLWIATAIAIALAAVSAWSWTWRSRRGALALRRSDFDRLALGSRCDPAWMTDDMREHIARTLTARLAEREDARPPEDVARLGARDVEEAILAYSVLRIAGVHHADARASAERLLAHSLEDPSSERGAYRESSAGRVSGLGAEISARAGVLASAAEAQMRAVSRRWFHDRWIQLAGLLCLTGLAGYQISTQATARPVGDAALTSGKAPMDERVRVRCDHVEDRDWKVVDGDDDVTKRVTFCWLGRHLLPVVSSDDDAADGPMLEGKLHASHATPGSWIAALHRDDELGARAHDVYLDAEGSMDRGAAIRVMLVAGVGAVVGWLLWIRAFRRRPRAG